MKMKSFFTSLCAVVLMGAMCIGASAQYIPEPIKAEEKALCYENSFESADALKDFKAYRGTWEVKDGRVRLASYRSTTNTYLLYNGDEKLCDLADYMMTFDMYNVQTAAGAIFRSQKRLYPSDSGMHDYMGYNILNGSYGRTGAIRVTEGTGSKSTNLAVSGNYVCKPGMNLHFEIVGRKSVISVTVYDADNGNRLWENTQINDSYLSGTFGFFAYTKIINGLDCRKTTFDNLKVYSLPEIEEKPMNTVSGGFSLATDFMMKSQNDKSMALSEVSLQDGTVTVDTPLPSSSVGLVFRCAEDRSSYYSFLLDSSKKVSLTRTLDGFTRTMKSTSLSAMGAGPFGVCTLRATFQGGRIWCYLNEICFACVEDTAPLTASGVGVYAAKAGETMLNFTVSQDAEPIRADIISFGHSHMQRFAFFDRTLAPYGSCESLGVGGSNTPYWVGLRNEILSYQPKIAVVMTGSNDIANTEPKQITEMVKNLFRVLRADLPDLKIILVTEWLQPTRLQYEAKIRELNDLYRAYAAENSEWLSIAEGFDIAMDENGEFSYAAFGGKTDVGGDSMHLCYEAYNDGLCPRIAQAVAKNSSFPVSFDMNNGTEPVVQTVAYGEVPDAPTPENGGASFLGWFTPDGVEWNGEAITGALTLTARWSMPEPEQTDPAPTQKQGGFLLPIVIGVAAVGVMAFVVVILKKRKRG